MIPRPRRLTIGPAQGGVAALSIAVAVAISTGCGSHEGERPTTAGEATKRQDESSRKPANRADDAKSATPGTNGDESKQEPATEEPGTASKPKGRETQGGQNTAKQGTVTHASRGVTEGATQRSAGADPTRQAPSNGGNSGQTSREGKGNATTEGTKSGGGTPGSSGAVEGSP
jgi:hypothetical protein